MIVPIFNSMMRIDRSLLEAADDAGASGWQTLCERRSLPLSKHRHRDRLDLRDHDRHGRLRHRRRDGRPADRLGRQDHPGADLATCSFPPAAANAMILLAVVLMIIVGPHPRSSISARSSEMTARDSGIASTRQRRFYWPWPSLFALFVLFLYGPMITIFVLSLPGPGRRPDVPDARRLAALVRGKLRAGRRRRRHRRRVLAARCGSALVVMVLTVVFSVLAGLAFRKTLQRRHGACSTSRWRA